jgi:hypothetical protein
MSNEFINIILVFITVIYFLVVNMNLATNSSTHQINIKVYFARVYKSYFCSNPDEVREYFLFWVYLIISISPLLFFPFSENIFISVNGSESAFIISRFSYLIYLFLITFSFALGVKFEENNKALETFTLWAVLLGVLILRVKFNRFEDVKFGEVSALRLLPSWGMFNRPLECLMYFLFLVRGNLGNNKFVLKQSGQKKVIFQINFGVIVLFFVYTFLGGYGLSDKVTSVVENQPIMKLLLNYIVIIMKYLIVILIIKKINSLRVLRTKINEFRNVLTIYTTLLGIALFTWVAMN